MGSPDEPLIIKYDETVRLVSEAMKKIGDGLAGTAAVLACTGSNGFEGWVTVATSRLGEAIELLEQAAKVHEKRQGA